MTKIHKGKKGGLSMKKALTVMLLVFVFSLTFACAEGVITEERILQVGDLHFYGHIYLPEGEGPFPTIIMSHGLGSSESMWATTATELASRGYACCAFDFRGGNVNKKSSGKSTQMSVLTEMDDLRMIIAAMREESFCDPDRFFLMGSSFGGLVTALTAPEYNEQVTAVSLWCPALMLPAGAREKYASADEITGRLMHDGMPLGKMFYADLLDLYMENIVGGYTGPVLFVHGDQDKTVPLQTSVEAVELYQNACLEILPGEDHSFTQKGKLTAADMVDKFFAEAANNK